MAVRKKFRPKWWPNNRQSPVDRTHANIALVPPVDARYDLRPLSVAQIDECWLLDQRCFVDGEAYSRDTFEYLLTAPESVSYRVVTQNSAMAVVVNGLLVPYPPRPLTKNRIPPQK